MDIEKKLEDGILTLAVDGRLDTNTAPALEAEVKLDGVTEVVFDFAGLEYISSAGLRVLLSAKKALAAVEGQVTVANANETVRNVFDITGLSDIFTMA